MGLQFRSAVDIAEGVNSGELDPVEVTEGFIERIEERNEATNAYVTVIGEKARERAKEVRRRVEESDADGPDLPLAGVPLAIKDLSESKEGVRHTMGLKPLEENVAEETTVTVSRLEEAGAVVVGTTNTPELGHSVRTENMLQGPTSTPFDTEKNSGGSSGGSAAALADGLCAIATGSDVGGSLRNPASCCGIVSVKPTHGVVPRGNPVNGFRGHTPVGVNGPMARDTEGLAAMFDVIAGKDATDPFSVPKTESYSDAVTDPPDASELGIAYSPDLDVFSVAPEVREPIEGVLSELEGAGATTEEVSFDLPDFGALTHAYSLQVTTFFATAVEELNEEMGMDLLGDHGEDLPNDLRTLVSMGETNDIMDYTEADFVRTDLYHGIQNVVAEYDALVCPTLATPPLTHDEAMPSEIDGEPTNGLPTSWMLSWIFNMTGHPVVNVPAGTADGLPVGAQVIGETHSEPRLLGIARVIEATRGWGYPEE